MLAGLSDWTALGRSLLGAFVSYWSLDPYAFLPEFTPNPILLIKPRSTEAIVGVSLGCSLQGFGMNCPHLICQSSEPWQRARDPPTTLMLGPVLPILRTVLVWGFLIITMV